MRSAGVLLPIFSLPSPYGIGTLGKAAYEFVDFLHDAKQTYWQVLPLGPTSYGDSPYQAFSTFAANPYFIDLDRLVEEGLLTYDEVHAHNWGSDPSKIDYGLLYNTRFEVLSHAADRLVAQDDEAFHAFCTAQRAWLDDYSLFMSLKNKFGGNSWQKWPEELRLRKPQALAQATEELAPQMMFWKALQYFFDCQWSALKVYANAKDVKIIGDVPIYVAEDSVDVWSHPELFQLDANNRPTEVAGCPPDGFSATGQLWGNPLFNWDAMKYNGYAWWMERIRAQFKHFDVLRIDHFRGFDSYYAIPFGATTAINGRWRKGPGKDFFDTLNKTLGHKPIIAEDLGFLTQSVFDLLVYCQYPGMKVLEFGFDSRDEGGRTYQPHRYTPHCVAYVGTHDNSTAKGWLESVNPADAAYARDYLHIVPQEAANTNGYETELASWTMMRAIWQSCADTAIVQMQDILNLGDEARINVPSTLGSNWCWRMQPQVDLHAVAPRLAQAMQLYERVPQTQERCNCA